MDFSMEDGKKPSKKDIKIITQYLEDANKEKEMKEIKWKTEELGDMVIASSVYLGKTQYYSLCHTNSEGELLWSVNDGAETKYFETEQEFLAHISTL